MSKRPYHRKTTKQIEWLRENAPYMSRDACLDAFEEKFGVRLSRGSLNTWLCSEAHTKPYGRPSGRLPDLVGEAQQKCGLPVAGLCRSAGLAESYLSGMMDKKSRISPGSALKLERASGIPAERWIEAAMYDYTGAKAKQFAAELKRLREEQE